MQVPSNATLKAMLKDTKPGWLYKDLDKNSASITTKHMRLSSALTTSDYSSQSVHFIDLNASLFGTSISRTHFKTATQTIAFTSNNILVSEIDNNLITSSSSSNLFMG
jgi:hypothetical protein